MFLHLLSICDSIQSSPYFRQLWCFEANESCWNLFELPNTLWSVLQETNPMSWTLKILHQSKLHWVCCLVQCCNQVYSHLLPSSMDIRITNLFRYGRIISTMGKFTHDIKGASSILSCELCCKLWPLRLLVNLLISIWIRKIV